MKKLKLTEDQIKHIAGELDLGLICFLDKNTGEVLSMPEEDEFEYGYMEKADWKEVIDKIKKNKKNYIRIEKMDSYESFRMMKDFAYTVDDKKVADRLFYALNNSKPFKNFRYELDYFDGYTDKWYEFKERALIEWVKEEIERGYEHLS